MIFCFTATGNSLHVARQLDSDVRSIPHELARMRAGDAARFEDGAIGIVSPVFYHELPAPVRDFIREAEFVCEYFFIVGTYGCRHGGFAELTRRFLEDCGKRADYINTIVMVDNALPGYDIAEQLRIDPGKEVDAHIELLRADVLSRRTFVQPVTDADLAHHFSSVERGVISPSDDDPLYSVGKACTGCGICARVCPLNCIEVRDGRAIHSPGECCACMGCIHACPTLAISFATLSEKNPGVHYRNPHVTLADLMAFNG